MTLIWIAIGMLIGWFFLPTPAFVKDAMRSVIAKFPLLASFIKKDSL